MKAVALVLASLIAHVDYLPYGKVSAVLQGSLGALYTAALAYLKMSGQSAAATEIEETKTEIQENIKVAQSRRAEKV